MSRHGRAILGGSFNPPHIGHLRLAVEAREALNGLIDGVELTPCALPPHKAAGNLLPFGLRAAMLEAAVSDLPFLRCNRLESRREGISYTWDMLTACRAALPGTDFYFLLGAPDFALLPTWFRGLELPSLCHFVVAPRGGMAENEFVATVVRLWPDAEERPSLLPRGRCLALPGGGLAYFLPLPCLNVSASDIRERWLNGRSVAYLVPRTVLRLLDDARAVAADRWQTME